MKENKYDDPCFFEKYSQITRSQQGLAGAGEWRELEKLLPADADLMPIYAAAGLSAAAVVLGLFSAAVAYYAMWALGIVVFALAVYYTVKQL